MLLHRLRASFSPLRLLRSAPLHTTALSHTFAMPPPHTAGARLSELRALMSAAQPEALAAYIVPSADAHNVRRKRRRG